MVDSSMLYVVDSGAAESAGGRMHQAVCDPGDFVLTGGCILTATQSSLTLVSMPYRGQDDLAGGIPDRWNCYWQVATGGAQTSARAVCVDVTP